MGSIGQLVTGLISGSRTDFLDHLRVRGFSPASRRAYAFDLLNLGRFPQQRWLALTGVTAMDVFGWVDWQRYRPSRRFSADGFVGAHSESAPRGHISKEGCALVRWAAVETSNGVANLWSRRSRPTSWRAAAGRPATSPRSPRHARCSRSCSTLRDGQTRCLTAVPAADSRMIKRDLVRAG
jgi:hypothetical protein